MNTETLTTIGQLQIKLDQYSEKGKQLAREIQVYKSHKLIKLLGLLRPPLATKRLLTRELYPLYAYSAQIYPGLTLYHLNEGADLSTSNKQIQYQIKLPVKEIKEILLSFAIDFFSTNGFVRLELFSLHNKLIAWASLPLDRIPPYSISHFQLTSDFGKLNCKEFVNKTVLLKISTDNCDIPVRLREWQRLDILKRQIVRLPFVAFTTAE